MQTLAGILGIISGAVLLKNEFEKLNDGFRIGLLLGLIGVIGGAILLIDGISPLFAVVK